MLRHLPQQRRPQAGRVETVEATENEGTEHKHNKPDKLPQNSSSRPTLVITLQQEPAHGDSPYPTPMHTSHHDGNAALLPTPAPTLATPSTTTIPAPIPIHAGHHDGDAALAPSR